MGVREAQVKHFGPKRAARRPAGRGSPPGPRRVNRPTTRSDGQQTYRDQVVMTMVRSGKDWLVDDMDTNNLAG